MERNALRAGLVAYAEDWQWGSAWRRVFGMARDKNILSDWPAPVPYEYSAFLNEPQTEAELDDFRVSLARGRPLGEDVWVHDMMQKFGLEATDRPRGRPKKNA